MLHFGVFDDVFYSRISYVDTEHDLGFGLNKVILNLLFGGKWMYHVGNGANFIDCVEHVDCFWSVRHTNGDKIAFFYTDGL